MLLWSVFQILEGLIFLEVILIPRSWSNLILAVSLALLATLHDNLIEIMYHRARECHILTLALNICRTIFWANFHRFWSIQNFIEPTVCEKVLWKCATQKSENQSMMCILGRLIANKKNSILLHTIYHKHIVFTRVYQYNVLC